MKGRRTDGFEAVFHPRVQSIGTAGRCFRQFPDECGGCDHYTEIVQKSLGFFEVVYQGFFTQIPMATITRECTKYHKKCEEGTDVGAGG